MNECLFSIIVPMKNEEALIEQTLAHIRSALRHFYALHKHEPPSEVIVVDNNSTDSSRQRILPLLDDPAFHYHFFEHEGAAKARNHGASLANGKLLVFVDGDTMVPPETLVKIRALHFERSHNVGIFRLDSLEGGFLAYVWWTFWNQVRRLPISKAKAMPAFMFCTRSVFAEFGPFNEVYQIAEEWPITAGYYKHHRKHFIYDRSTIGLSSNRRMALQRFGYVKTLVKYGWAILHKSGRYHFKNTVRH